MVADRTVDAEQQFLGPVGRTLCYHHRPYPDATVVPAAAYRQPPLVSTDHLRVSHVIPIRKAVSAIPFNHILSPTLCVVSKTGKSGWSVREDDRAARENGDPGWLTVGGGKVGRNVR